MKLLALLVLVLQPQDSTIRQELFRLTLPGCGEEMADRVRRLARISNAALEELPAMIKEAEGEQRGHLLYLYAQIASWKEIPRTPAVIVNLARSGTGPDHIAAAGVMLKIRDERSTAFIIEGLARLAADERTLEFSLDRAIIAAAGNSRSNEVGKRLLALIDYPNVSTRWLVIDALGTLVYAPATGRLKELTAETDKTIAGAANHALEKLGVLSSADLAGALVEKVRGKRASGEFSWSRWSLDRIVNLNMKETAPALRADYDEFVKKFGAATEGTQWAAVLLHAIHTLGGKLSHEETALLTDLGRLPPAKLTDAGEEKLVEGFEKSVWAPRAQRLKELEARRAPPPRIPEEKLPRNMKERITFVMNLQPPDPSYLAPNALLALGEIEEMLGTERDPATRDKLMEAYWYLARLREGMKTPDVMLGLAREHRHWAMRVVTTIADDRAEAWFLDELKGPRADHMANYLERLSGAAVMQALLKVYREDPGGRIRVAYKLADLGCVELLPELKAVKSHYPEVRLAIEKLEILAAPDRDAKLLATTMSMRMSGEHSWYHWGLDQIVRLDLKRLAPDLRAWFDRVKVKWTPSQDPTHLSVKVPFILFKLGAPITPEEEALLKRSGRRP